MPQRRAKCSGRDRRGESHTAGRSKPKWLDLRAVAGIGWRVMGWASAEASDLAANRSTGDEKRDWRRDTECLAVGVVSVLSKIRWAGCGAGQDGRQGHSEAWTGVLPPDLGYAEDEGWR